jgi:hypothetical protein
MLSVLHCSLKGYSNTDVCVLKFNHPADLNGTKITISKIAQSRYDIILQKNYFSNSSDAKKNERNIPSH